ncbi:MAG: 3-keto-disaccharide hydrolase [Akkermansiaceae bacterium]
MKMRHLSTVVVGVLMLAACHATAGMTPEGFTSLFNGKDFNGWRAENPHDYVKLKDAKKIAAKRAEDLKVFPTHWQVKDGVIHNDGHGPYLCTIKDYGDVEFHVDFLLDPNSDSGIYLRGTPQVQIWDTREEAGKWRYGADKGSGGLWNNKGPGTGKHPLVHADKPIGEWNHLRIRQIGSCTWVWLNDKLVVDRAHMQNFWNRKRPLDKAGPIILQTHGAPVQWRNIFVREIPAAEADQILAEATSGEGWQHIFDGEDLGEWQASVPAGCEIKNGAVYVSKGQLIYRKQKYADFKLAFEFQLPAGGNNGLLVRYPGEGDGAYVGMCELQILDNTAKQHENLDARQFHGSAYGIAPAHRGYLRPVGEWNHQIVTVKGSHIQVELNGVPILDADLSKVEQFMDNKPHPGLNVAEGYIGFAGHGAPVGFRNIRVRD